MKLSVSTKGKTTITLDFPGKTAEQVTIADVKAGVTNKFPQVSERRVASSSHAATLNADRNARRLLIPACLQPPASDPPRPRGRRQEAPSSDR